VEWLYWAIFSSTVEDGEEFLSEAEEYLVELEQCSGTKLIPGHDPKIKPIRVTLDPVRTAHKPLIWYLVSMSLRSREASHHSQSTRQLVGVIDTCSFPVLYPLGFKHHSPGSIFHVFPPRPFTMFSDPSPVPLPYWYRPHRSRTKTPVLFLHGIGVPLLSLQPEGQAIHMCARRLGYCPTFPLSGNSPKKIPTSVSLSWRYYHPSPHPLPDCKTAP